MDVKHNKINNEKEFLNSVRKEINFYYHKDKYFL